jgi:DhnA family fructose-bisphosphate aldolase class Ia
MIEDKPMNNKQYRFNDLFNPVDGRSLVVDTSSGLILGALPGLERFNHAVQPLLSHLDGIVTSPGQARNLGTRTQQQAGLIIRADWTNALRGDDFVLPPENIAYLPLLEPKDALDLGANALVMHFILGYEEQIEAQCLHRSVNLALDGLSLGMPLILDVQPIGPRVVLINKAIELGVSYALESGVDGIVIPWPGIESLETIQAMCSGTPVWIKLDRFDADWPELNEALGQGIAGFWLGEGIFAVDHPATTLQTLKSLVHTLLEA